MYLRACASTVFPEMRGSQPPPVHLSILHFPKPASFPGPRLVDAHEPHLLPDEQEVRVAEHLVGHGIPERL
eukprot:165304-Lingulodinium_polyedra.AAC.1